MANFETKTIKQIYDGIIAKYTTLRNKYGDSAPLLEKAAVRSLAYAIAGVAGTLWQLATWIYKQCFPQTCGLAALKFWGNLVGANYKNGEAASLTIELKDVSAQALSAGTTYKHLSSGLIYKTISTVNAIEGVITATAQCTTSGSVGNLATAEELQIANPYDGIPSTASVVNIAVNGTEDEDVEDYRKRVLYKFRNKSQCGSPLDYYIWATEVTGIVDALVYILNAGIVKIFLVSTGSGQDRTPSGSLNPNPFPVWENGQFKELTGSGQMLAVANAIEGTSPGVHDRRPAKATVELSGPNYTPFKIEISGLTDTSYNPAIKDALISVLDGKRPNIVVLGYSEANAKVNKQQLSSAVQGVIGAETFTTIILRDGENNSIDETTLGIGCLAYLSALKINGEEISLD